MENGHVNGMDAPQKTTTRVRIGASEYEPRWSFLAEYILSTRGLTLLDVLNEGNQRGGKWVSMVMELLAATIAHHFPTGGALTADQLSTQVTGPAHFAEIVKAVYGAGRAAGAIVDNPKNPQAPAEQLATQAEKLPTQ